MNDIAGVATFADAVSPAPVAVPTPEELAAAEAMLKQRNAEHLAKVKAAIEANKNPFIKMTEMDFHFKKDKKLGTKRPTVKLAIPMVTAEGIIDILDKGGKELELLLEAVSDVIYNAGRGQVNDKEDISQDTLDLEKLSWTSIANQPKAERRGGGIAAETWEEFGEDYMAVMPAAVGKTAEQVGNAAKLLLGKFNACKSNKKVLAFLKEQLAIWFSNTQNAEELAPCYEFLDNKATVLLNTDEAKLLENL